jgi:hypothetical protein
MICSVSPLLFGILNHLVAKMTALPTPRAAGETQTNQHTRHELLADATQRNNMEKDFVLRMSTNLSRGRPQS